MKIRALIVALLLLSFCVAVALAETEGMSRSDSRDFCDFTLDGSNCATRRSISSEFEIRILTTIYIDDILCR